MILSLLLWLSNLIDIDKMMINDSLCPLDLADLKLYSACCSVCIMYMLCFTMHERMVWNSNGPYVIKLEQKPSILYQYYLSLEACETQEIITKNEYLEIFAFRYSIFFLLTTCNRTDGRGKLLPLRIWVLPLQPLLLLE